MGRIVRTISQDASVVASVLEAKDIVNEIERIHQSSAVVTAALGRLAIAASLMGIGLKGDNDSLTLRVNGNGPAGTLVAVADSFGNVKADVINPVVEIPLNQYGKLDVRGAVGTNGTLSVIKDIGLKEPYIGQTALISGEIGEDIAGYFVSSEQIPTACGLGVLIAPDLSVQCAGGFLIQLLPFADEKCIETLEHNINKLPSVTQMFENGMDAEKIALHVLEGLSPNVLDAFDAAYKCDCNRRRVERILISLGKTELEKLAEEQESTEVNCHFCGKKYCFTKYELQHLL